MSDPIATVAIPVRRPVPEVFNAFAPSATRVSVEASGFKEGDVDALVNTTEGFSIVLCDLKTLLESGHSANLVKDKADLIARSA